MSRHPLAQAPEAYSAQGFIDKIEAARDQALAAIASETRDDVARIHREAYRSARAFHRATAEQTRRSCAAEAARHSARASALLRRESWRALRRLQEAAVRHMRDRLNALYAEPDRQWAWCSHWLKIALVDCGGHQLRLTLGRGIDPGVRRRIETSLRQLGARWTLETRENLGCGILIAWRNQVLDGRLEAQQPFLADDVFQRLARELHATLEGGEE
jgi:hypothetical protein